MLIHQDHGIFVGFTCLILIISILVQLLVLEILSLREYFVPILSLLMIELDTVLEFCELAHEGGTALGCSHDHELAVAWVAVAQFDKLVTR